MLGAHMSISGGFDQAARRARQAGCDCLQIFVKNQRRWHAPPIEEAAVRNWRRARNAARTGPVVAHSTYLINLAAPVAVVRHRSLLALVDELRRCEQLGIGDLVLHPGCHMGRGEKAGLRRVASALRAALERTESTRTRILLETTAGQGTALGGCFEHLSELLERAASPVRLGVCLDTCHVFAAGYDIRTVKGYMRAMNRLDSAVGLGRVGCIHLNDSKAACGSRVDRHEHVGEGMIGRIAFKCLVNDTRLEHIPMILETPKGRDSRGRDLDRVNLARLRRMRR
ncbi:MAG: deoxyribonuclease IV [Phycisphaerales bacterium]|nr:MAG: deoxyribonuclease IV [Phycisphaerales bacterium]